MRERGKVAMDIGAAIFSALGSKKAEKPLPAKTPPPAGEWYKPEPGDDRTTMKEVKESLRDVVHADRQATRPAGAAAAPAPAAKKGPATKKDATLTTICIAAQKGGAGKTTLAQCLAVEALRQGMPSAIVDLDPQRSALAWGEQRAARDIDAPTVVGVPANSTLRSVVDELQARGAEFIIIDTPPHAAALINAALEIATAAIMVTRPNPMDLESLGVTWSIVQRTKLPTATVFTQVPPGDRTRALRLGQGLLDQLGIAYCPTPLTYTLSYPYAQAEALAVQEREPTGKARAEVAEVWSWMKREKIF